MASTAQLLERRMSRLLDRQPGGRVSHTPGRTRALTHDLAAALPDGEGGEGGEGERLPAKLAAGALTSYAAAVQDEDRQVQAAARSLSQMVVARAQAKVKAEDGDESDSLDSDEAVDSDDLDNKIDQVKEEIEITKEEIRHIDDKKHAEKDIPEEVLDLRGLNEDEKWRLKKEAIYMMIEKKVEEAMAKDSQNAHTGHAQSRDASPAWQRVEVAGVEAYWRAKAQDESNYFDSGIQEIFDHNQEENNADDEEEEVQHRMSKKQKRKQIQNRLTSLPIYRRVLASENRGSIESKRRSEEASRRASLQSEDASRPPSAASATTTPAPDAATTAAVAAARRRIKLRKKSGAISPNFGYVSSVSPPTRGRRGRDASPSSNTRSPAGSRQASAAGSRRGSGGGATIEAAGGRRRSGSVSRSASPPKAAEGTTSGPPKAADSTTSGPSKAVEGTTSGPPKATDGTASGGGGGATTSSSKPRRRLRASRSPDKGS